MLLAASRTNYETRTLTVGFSQDLPAGVTISSAIVTAETGPSPCTVKDANPSATLSGAAFVNTQPLSINTPNGPVVQAAGHAVLQVITSGVTGMNYVYRFKCTGSDGKTYEADVQQFCTAYVPTP